MSNQTPPDKEHRFVGVLAVAGVFLIFFAIIMIAYVPNRPGDPDSERAAYRTTTRKAVDAAMKKANEGYEWLDKPAGDVRLPIDQAMQLTLDAYQNKETLFTPTPQPPAPAASSL